MQHVLNITQQMWAKRVFKAFLFIIRIIAMQKMPSGHLAFCVKQVSVGICDRTQRVSVVWLSAQKRSSLFGNCVCRHAHEAMATGEGGSEGLVSSVSWCVCFTHFITTSAKKIMWLGDFWSQKFVCFSVLALSGDLKLTHTKQVNGNSVEIYSERVRHWHWTPRIFHCRAQSSPVIKEFRLTFESTFLLPFISS